MIAPREGDRVRFNPPGTDTVIEGTVDQADKRYLTGYGHGTYDRFTVRGVRWATHLTRWVTDERAADYEHFVAENLKIVKRLYRTGDEVNDYGLDALPVGAGVVDVHGDMWQKQVDQGWVSATRGGVYRSAVSLASPDTGVGPLKVVYLP